MNTPAYTPPATHDTWPPATPDEQSLPPAPLAGRRLVLGVTGGVAAYKAAQLVRDLGRAGAHVQVVMTEAATRFVGAVTFQALSGNPVYTDAFDARIDDNMPHIELSRQADAILVAPATADFIAKLAHGHCDDLLSTLCVARDVPLLVAPAMNRQMWQNPATQRNINQLRADGIGVLGPDAGEQACGEVGAGRMLEPLDLIEELNAFFTPKRLQGKRILLTAGPTYEAIDPVRGITNQSSGKMGYALAQACRRAGASVTLVSGPTQLPRPAGVRFIGVQSARQMLDAVTAELDLAASTISIDCFIAVAAVADWRPAQEATQKIKKPSAQPPLIEPHAPVADGLDASALPDTEGTPAAGVPSIPLVENPDVLATVARRHDAPYCVGFAAETENLVQHATEKRLRKGVPLLVANLGPATFNQDHNTLLLVDEAGHHPLPSGSKTALARQLVEELAQRLPA